MTRVSRRSLMDLLIVIVIIGALVVFALLIFMALNGRATADQTAPTAPRVAQVTAASRSFARPALPTQSLRLTGGDPISEPADQQASPAARTPTPTPAHSTAPAPANGSGVVARKTATPEPTSHDRLRARIAWCESRDEPTVVNKATGASGLYQFLDSTWHSVTGLPGKASDYPAAVQTEAFETLYAQRGTAPWSASKSCWGKS